MGPEALLILYKMTHGNEVSGTGRLMFRGNRAGVVFEVRYEELEPGSYLIAKNGILRKLGKLLHSI